MKSAGKFAILVLLAVSVAATFALRGAKRAAYVPPAAEAGAPVAQAASPAGAGPAVALPPVSAAAASAGSATTASPAAPAAPGPPAAPATPAAPVAPRPRLVELGSVRCQACQQMMKVLDALRASQGERLQVDFVDVFEDPAAGDRYGLTLIPTQIFFDAAGKEIFRHTGFLSHDDILAKYRELGVKL